MTVQWIVKSWTVPASDRTDEIASHNCEQIYYFLAGSDEQASKRVK